MILWASRFFNKGNVKVVIQKTYFFNNNKTTQLKNGCAVCLVTQLCLTLWPHGLQPTRLLCPWGFSRQEYWSMLPCSPPGDLPDPGMEPRSSALQAVSFPTEPLQDWNRYLFKGDKEMANRHRKRCSLPLFIKEMQIVKSTTSYQL